MRENRRVLEMTKTSSYRKNDPYLQILIGHVGGLQHLALDFGFCLKLRALDFARSCPVLRDRFSFLNFRYLFFQIKIKSIYSKNVALALAFVFCFGSL